MYCGRRLKEGCQLFCRKSAPLRENLGYAYVVGQGNSVALILGHMWYVPDFELSWRGVDRTILSAYFRRQHAPTLIDRLSDVRRPTFK